MQLTKKTGFMPSLNNWFDDLFFTNDFAPAFRPNQLFKGHSALPAVNIKETPTDFHIEIAAPGMRKEDFQIEIKDQLLTISSEQKSEKEEKGEAGKFVRREFSYTSFKRSFTLPEDSVDAQKIAAKYQDGILQLDIPKKVVEKTETKRLIDIQ